MLTLAMPTGKTVPVAESLPEDMPYFSTSTADPHAVKSYYDEQGYVVLRGLIPPALCATLQKIYGEVVRSSKTPMLRQKNMCYERNEFDGDGFLKNPIFNVQDLGSGRLDSFRQAALRILTDKATIEVTANLLGGERTKVIQSMFFEAPAGTWAHQDSYYQDSATATGLCVAGWFAMEDIDAGAGRFFVCPRSHREFPLVRNAGRENVATGHVAYKESVIERMRERQVEFSVPFLKAGDVLFWSSRTVHGSLPASRPGVSRMSLTAHYLREYDDMLQFHTRIRPMKTMQHNGTTVCLLHDQDELRNRLIRETAYHFPGAYMAARKAALKALLLWRRSRRDLRNEAVPGHDSPGAVSSAPF